MDLTLEEKDILEGKQGEMRQKIMETVVEYGQMFDATHLAPIDYGAHMVMGFGLSIFKPYYEMMEEIIDSGLSSAFPFTCNPRPGWFKDIKTNIGQKIVNRIMFKNQNRLEKLYRKLGLKDENAFTCTSFLPEVENVPRYGQVVAAAESMVVIYVNSVIGARTHRNAGGMEMLFSVLGKVPVFGYLTDEGRKAQWLVKLNCKTLPNAQILGSIIGDAVMEETFYVQGLEAHLGTELDEAACSYLKDLGGLASTTGAMGLFHAHGLTPEAKAQEKGLLATGYRTLEITDDMIHDYPRQFPVMWKKKEARPKKAFIGCPHLTAHQLIHWSDAIAGACENAGVKGVQLETVLFAAPDVIARFKIEFPDKARQLLDTGAVMTSTCPNLYMANPLSQRIPVVTNSNKHRIYSNARFYRDEDLLQIIAQGRLPEVYYYERD